MPAMDFCNTMEFPIAILWNFNLQLSVFLSYNKQECSMCMIKRAEITLNMRRLRMQAISVQKMSLTDKMVGGYHATLFSEPI